ncbi:MAG: hypothetical protein IJ524_08935 [Bacteroidales bacterium]|nr:hypothetical protein [Bacteroidales bacterium]
MKRIVLVSMAVAAMLATGCRHREAPAMELYPDGTTAAEVGRTLEAGGYDFALMATTKDRQMVTYGWRDSLHFITYYYSDSIDDGQSDYASEQSLTDEGVVTLEPMNDSVWTLRLRSVPKWVLNIRLGWTRVTTDGVEFDVRFWGIPMARCTFVCDDPALLSTRLLELPEVRELVLHVVFVQLLSADMAEWDDDWDDLDDIKEQIADARREAEQSHGKVTLIDTVFVSHGCSADRSFDRLERRARELGYSSLELRHQEGHKGCWLEVTHGPAGVKKCHRRMEEMAKAAGEEGLAFSVQHNGDPHIACTVRAWKAD